MGFGNYDTCINNFGRKCVHVDPQNCLCEQWNGNTGFANDVEMYDLEMDGYNINTWNSNDGRAVDQSHLYEYWQYN
jgi:hypothetical protein